MFYNGKLLQTIEECHNMRKVKRMSELTGIVYCIENCQKKKWVRYSTQGRLPKRMVYRRKENTIATNVINKSKNLKF